MQRYARALIGLVAAILAVAVVHRLMAPQLATGAYGGPLDAGWLSAAVDLLAFVGTLVIVGGSAVGRLLGDLGGRMLDCAGPGTAAIEPEPPANDPQPERWSPAEELAGRLSLKALKGGDAGEYLRVFRLLHPSEDAALAAALPAPEPTAAGDGSKTTRTRSTRAKK